MGSLRMAMSPEVGRKGSLDDLMRVGVTRREKKRKGAFKISKFLTFTNGYIEDFFVLYSLKNKN